MTECTGKIANTIHSLVCFVKYTAKTCNDVYSQLEKKFGILSRSANGTYIIVDEFSMVDQCLLYDLLSCINELNSTYRTRIIGMIVIGDTSQLPSVGRGSVLGDMVGAKVFEHVHLTKTYRQKGNSNILDNANNVRNMQSIKFMREKDFYCSEYDDETLKKYINHFKSKYDNDLDFYKNVQVCTFLNATCKKVALICKEVLRNDSSEEYSVGDKVINCKNDKDAGISNGDMGIIENIEKKYNKKGVVTETKYVVYFYDIDIRAEITSENLKTGYCCTVHKLQGSEYKTIIIIAEKSILLEHRMLYTAITRGKENCIIMGEKSTIEKACRTSHDSKRLTFFKEKLIKEFAGEE
jgi:exodeoxyribonuclease V alpha subunit